MFGKTCLEKRVKMRALRQEENGAAAAAAAAPASTSSQQQQAAADSTRFNPARQLRLNLRMSYWEIVIF